MYGKRLPPKPEQPPEGMIFNPAEWIFGENRKFIYAYELEHVCQRAVQKFDSDVRSNPYIVQQMGISELHKYSMLPFNHDPSYNWRKKRGSRNRSGKVGTNGNWF